MKPPNTLDKYESSVSAGAKLVQLALDHVIGCRDGVKVRWSLTISYWHDDWSDAEKLKALERPVITRNLSMSNL